MLRVINHVKQAASRVDNKYLAEFQARRRQQEKYAAEEEMKIKIAVKQREHLLELEKLRLDVTDARGAKRQRLIRLARRQVIILSENKRAEEEKETPTNILSNSHFNNEEPKRDCNDQREEIEDGDTTQPEDGEFVNSKSKEDMSTEELRLAAQAEASEEIRMAKEVKAHLMAKLAEERKETEQVEKNDGDNKFDDVSEEVLFGIEISKICTLLNCTEQELHESNISGSTFDPVLEILENSEMNSDIVQSTVTSIVDEIEGFNARLLDIEAMQSILLAENAALRGEDEFKVSEEGIQLGDDNSFNPIQKSKTQTSPEQRLDSSPQQAFLSTVSTATKRTKEKMITIYDRLERKIRTEESDSQTTETDDSDSLQTETESATSKQKVVAASE